MSIATYNAAIPENISRIIRERGLKQSYVAEKAGLTDSQLSGIMKGGELLKSVTSYSFLMLLGSA